MRFLCSLGSLLVLGRGGWGVGFGSVLSVNFICRMELARVDTSLLGDRGLRFYSFLRTLQNHMNIRILLLGYQGPYEGIL